MARLDEDGFIFLVDRKKDVIICGGENVFPVEVEDFLHTNTKIKDVAAIGYPDDRLGEIVTVVVELVPGQAMTRGGGPCLLRSTPQIQTAAEDLFRGSAAQSDRQDRKAEAAGKIHRHRKRRSRRNRASRLARKDHKSPRCGLSSFPLRQMWRGRFDGLICLGNQCRTSPTYCSGEQNRSGYRCLPRCWNATFII